ncbi:MAG: sulfatase [Acidobacteriota bacterium]
MGRLGRPPWVQSLRTAALLAAVLAVGCADRTVERRSIERFIDDPSPPVFDPSDLLAEASVRSWRFRGTPPGAFAIDAVTSTRADGVGWWMMPESRRVVLRLDGAGLPADEIDTVRVVVEGRRLGGATLHWGPADEPIEATRRLTAPFSARVRETFHFPVGEHPQWRGEIGRLMLTVFTGPGSEVGVTAIDAVGPVEAPPVAVLEQPWRIELDGDGDFNDRRTALVGWPGHAHRRTLETVPAAARLRLAYGLWSSDPSTADEVADRGDVRFRAVVETPEGSAVLGDMAWSADGAPFTDVSFDLAPFAGRRAEVRLEVSADLPLDPTRSLPLWAHPEMTAPADPVASPQPDVVVIVADTLRADRLSLYGHSRPTSPNLSAWAKRHAAVFESAVSSAGWTLPAHMSLFSGVDAPRHGVNWPSSQVGARWPMLAERLYRRGYRTEAITGGGYLDPSFGLDRGFERYLTWPRGRSSHEAEPTRVMDTALERLRRARDGGPLFLFVHTYATHAPYAPWQPFFGEYSELPALLKLDLALRNLGGPQPRHIPEIRRGGRTVDPAELGFGPGEVRRLVEDQYDAGVARLDGLLRPLLDAASASDRLIVFTSDHGEMLGEGDAWSHPFVFDPALKVPLLVAGPAGLGAGRRIPDQVRLIDIAPTIFDLLGLSSSEDVDGRSLGQLLRGETASRARPAWSYGQRVDEGVTVRLRDRLKLQVLDDLLAESPGEARAFDIGPSPRQERRIDLDPELLPLVEEARARLLVDLPGLHLRFSNQKASEALRFTVESGAAVAERVKVPDLRCSDCVRWRPPVGLEVDVPAGEAFTVVLGDVRDARLRMTLHRADGGRQRLTLDLTEHDRPLAMAVVDGRFQVTAGPPPETGVGVRMVAGANLDGSKVFGDDRRLDPETEAALRALGYVD